MQHHDLHFTDYQNLTDGQINKTIYLLLDFDEVDFVFCSIEFKSISHFKGTKQYFIRVYNLGEFNNNG